MSPSASPARQLVAVLLNPPSNSSGNRTLRAVERAAVILRCDTYQVVNLFEVSSQSVTDLSRVSVAILQSPDRRAVSSRLASAHSLLAAWGTTGLSGPLRQSRISRARTVLELARQEGHSMAWTVGGSPRHPSRWHQYVADKYARTGGGSFEERLRDVLVPTSIDDLFRPLGSSRSADCLHDQITTVDRAGKDLQPQVRQRLS